MRHVEHDNGMALFLDPVTDAPVLSATCGVLASVFVVERMADAARVIKERANDELSGCRGDLLRKTRELALSAQTHVEAPATASIRHAAPVLRNK
jgi:hypothetical protein